MLFVYNIDIYFIVVRYNGYPADFAFCEILFIYITFLLSVTVTL